MKYRLLLQSTARSTWAHCALIICAFHLIVRTCSGQSLELQVEPGRAAHSFELLIDGAVASSSSISTELRIDGGYSHFWIATGVEPRGYPGSTFALRDVTVDETSTFAPDFDPQYVGPQLISLAGNFTPADGLPKLYLCIPSDLLNNGLVVVYPSLGLSTAINLTSRYSYFPDYTDYFTEGIAVNFPGHAWYVYDPTTYRKAPVGAHYLPGANWELSLDDVPVEAGTLTFSASDEGYRFTLRYFFPETAWMVKSVTPVLDPNTGQVTAATSLPRGAQYYLSRDVDGAPSQTHTVTAYGFAADFQEVFPPRTKRTQEFYVNSYSGGNFRVRQPHAVFPTVVTMTDQVTYFPGPYGNYDEFRYNILSAEIDNEMSFALEDSNSGSILPEGEMTWWGGFQPYQPPPPEDFTIDVFWLRAYDMMVYSPDGSSYYPNSGNFMSETHPSVWTSGPVAEFNLSYYRLSLSAVPLPGENWRISYPNEWGWWSEYVVGPGYQDYKAWYPPPSSMQLQISATRYGHDLRLRQPHTNAEFYVNQQGSAGGFYQGGTFSYWYADADVMYTSGFDFWIHDATTGEDAPVNTTNLADWLHPVAPTIDTVSAPWPGYPMFISYHLNAPGAAQIRVQRRFADLSDDWSEVGTFEAPQPWSGTAGECQLSGLQLGETYVFRMQALYGGATSPWSNEVTATVETPFAATYQYIAASLLESSISQAKLVWACSAPTSEGAFDVQTRTSSSGAWFTIGTVNAVDFTAEGPTAGSHQYEFQPIWLQPGTTHQFRVRLVRPADDYYENSSPIASLTAPPDSDGDGIPDTLEANYGTDPENPDSDDDGILDGDEVAVGLNPNNDDSDGDGITDGADLFPLDNKRSAEIPMSFYGRWNLSEYASAPVAVTAAAVDDQHQFAFSGYSSENDGFQTNMWQEGEILLSHFQPATTDVANVTKTFTLNGVVANGTLFGDLEVSSQADSYRAVYTRNGENHTEIRPPAPKNHPYAINLVVVGEDGSKHGYIHDLFPPLPPSTATSDVFREVTFAESVPNGLENNYRIAIGASSPAGKFVGIETIDVENGQPQPPPKFWLWNGGLTPLPLTVLQTASINDQEQMVGGYGSDAFFYEDGVRTPFLNLIPTKYRQQLSGIQPKFITNQNAQSGEPIIRFSAASLEGPHPGSWVARDFQLYKDASDETILMGMDAIAGEADQNQKRVNSSNTAVAVVNGVAEAQPELEWRERQFKVHLGFDAPIKGDFHPGVGKDFSPGNHAFWASVVKTGDGKTNEAVQVWFKSADVARNCKLVIPEDSADYLDVEPKDVALTPVPDPAGGDGFVVPFKIMAKSPMPGIANQTFDDKIIELRSADGENQLRAVLTVMILPEVKLDLAIYRVESSTDGVTATANTKLPNNLPTDDTLIDRFNEIFQQAGVTFTKNAKSQARLINYDLNEDGKLETRTPAPGDTEFKRLREPAELNEGKINLIIFRGPLKPNRDAGVAGWAPVDDAGHFIAQRQVFMMTWASVPTDPQYLDFTIGAAHEIGHALGLSTRNSYRPDVGGKLPSDSGGHDWGLFPAERGRSTTLDMFRGLMWYRTAPSQKWLRHEDWRQANDRAFSLAEN